MLQWAKYRYVSNTPISAQCGSVQDAKQRKDATLISGGPQSVHHTPVYYHLFVCVRPTRNVFFTADPTPCGRIITCSKHPDEKAVGKWRFFEYNHTHCTLHFGLLGTCQLCILSDTLTAWEPYRVRFTYKCSSGSRAHSSIRLSGLLHH